MKFSILNLLILILLTSCFKLSDTTNSENTLPSIIPKKKTNSEVVSNILDLRPINTFTIKAQASTMRI